MYERLYWYYPETGSAYLGGRSKDQFLGYLKSQSKSTALEEIGMAANSAKHSLRVSRGQPPSFDQKYTGLDARDLRFGAVGLPFEGL